MILSIILLTALKSFSQKDTQKDSIVRIEPTIARLVVKDLVLFDANQQKLGKLQNLNDLYVNKIGTQQNVIRNLTTQINNLKSISGLKDSQIDNYSEMTRQLNFELSKEKFKNKIITIGGVAVTLSLTTLLLLAK